MFSRPLKTISSPCIFVSLETGQVRRPHFIHSHKSRCLARVLSFVVSLLRRRSYGSSRTPPKRSTFVGEERLRDKPKGRLCRSTACTTGLCFDSSASYRPVLSCRVRSDGGATFEPGLCCRGLCRVCLYVAFFQVDWPSSVVAMEKRQEVYLICRGEGRTIIFLEGEDENSSKTNTFFLRRCLCKHFLPVASCCRHFVYVCKHFFGGFYAFANNVFFRIFHPASKKIMTLP